MSKKFNLHPLLKQTNMFEVESTNRFPPVYRDIDNFRRILNSAVDYLGNDYEFATLGPTAYKAVITGIATETESCALRSTPELVKELVETARRKKLKLVGHAVIGAEMRVVETTTGIKQSVDEYEDSMLSHFLLNQDLTKAPDKKEEDDAGALGFMGLWTAASMELDVPAWKQCHGSDCSGSICPDHDLEGYCAVDSWASIAAFKRHLAGFQKWNIPTSVYNNFKQTSYIAELMHRRGIKIDLNWLNELEKNADVIKEKMFPFTLIGGKKVYDPFNPKASKQILEWFSGKGISLKSTDIKEIRKWLEKESKSAGFTLKDEDGKFSLHELEEADELPETLDVLYREYEFKSSGKGLGPWFDPKYRDVDNYIYPRFITVGTSTTRLSSSRPNFQNIPARGFGALVRAAIIARDSSLDLVKSDLSQVELRVCLWLSGVDPSIIGKDAFTWLVEKAEGKFDRAAELMSADPRQAAKSVSHAADYMEGLTVLKPIDLMRPNIKRDIERGILRVYLKKYGAPFDWEYRGGIIAFTGANLAERLFGSKSHENRHKALEIQEDIYFAKFPMIRTWQKSVLDQIQDKGYIRYPTGHLLRLYGRPEEDAKMACAALGQGVSAQYIQGVTRRFYAEQGAFPLMQVHDENDFEVPVEWSDKRVAEFMQLMGEEVEGLPGFKAAYKTIRGKNWLEYSEKNPATHIPGAMKPLVIGD